MEINPIRTEADYQAALKEVERLFNAPPNTPEYARLDLLSTLAEAYEKVHYPIEAPDPIEAILYSVKDRGLNNLQNCLEAIRSAFPHPLTPSPRAGEGEQETPAPLSRSGRGAGGEGQKLRLFNPRS